MLAYPQAEVEGNIYMKLPKGFSHQEKETKNTCSEAVEKYIWIETGWASMECTSAQGISEASLPTIQGGSMPILLVL